MAYFRAHPDAGVTRPDQIAVVGDRLSTDIMMANMMGSYGVWVRDGATGRGFVSLHFLVPNDSDQAVGKSNIFEHPDNPDLVREDGGPAAGLFVSKGLLGA